MTDDRQTLRIDKWLWYARFFKSRSQASRLAADGKIRVDGKRVERAHFPVKVGNVLTFPMARTIRVVRILELGTRRGPATEARTLFEDLTEGAEEPKPSLRLENEAVASSTPHPNPPPQGGRELERGGCNGVPSPLEGEG